MKAEITVTEWGSGSAILLDGLDVASAVQGFTFVANIAGPPELSLDPLWLDGGTLVVDGVKVDVLPKVREALIHLGWIPPEIARNYFPAPPALPDVANPALPAAEGSSAAPPPAPTG